MEHYVYLVFSATPYKMGRFIRKVTRQQYNHVSVALDERLQTMYSFARHYKDTPFYGGFVKETQLRYSYKDSSSRICVCAIPVSEEEYNKINLYIKELQENQKQYLYNTFSAICTPMRFRIHIDKSYTCTEFAINVLAKVNNEITPSGFYSIMELQDILKDYVIYEGGMKMDKSESAVCDEEFLRKHNVLGRSALTFMLIRQLVWRFCSRTYL